MFHPWITISKIQDSGVPKHVPSTPQLFSPALPHLTQLLRHDEGGTTDLSDTTTIFSTWLISLSKWVITPVISGLNPLIETHCDWGSIYNNLSIARTSVRSLITFITEVLAIETFINSQIQCLRNIGTLTWAYTVSKWSNDTCLRQISWTVII